MKIGSKVQYPPTQVHLISIMTLPTSQHMTSVPHSKKYSYGTQVQAIYDQGFKSWPFPVVCCVYADQYILAATELYIFIQLVYQTQP